MPTIDPGQLTLADAERRQRHLDAVRANGLDSHLARIADPGMAGEVPYHLAVLHGVREDDLDGRTPAELIELHRADHAIEQELARPNHQHDGDEYSRVGPDANPAAVVRHLVTAHDWDSGDDKRAWTVGQLIDWHAGLHQPVPVAKLEPAHEQLKASFDAAQRAGRALVGVAEQVAAAMHGPDVAKRMTDARLAEQELRIERARLTLVRERRRERRDQLLHYCYLTVAGCFAAFCLLILLVLLASL